MVAVVIFAVSTLLSLLTGLAVLLVDKKQKANRIYALTAGSYILLGLANFLSLQTDGDTKLFFARAVMLFTCIAVTFTYYLVRALTKGSDVHSIINVQPGSKKLISVLALAAVSALSLSPAVIADVQGSVMLFGPGIAVFALYMLVYVVSAQRALLQVIWSRASSDIVRLQSKYLFVGYLPVLLFAPLTGVYLPVVHGDLRFIAMTPAYTAIFVMTVGYAMVRHKLFGIRFYVLRMMAFSISQIALSLIYVLPLVYISALLFGVEPSALDIALGTLIVSTVATYYDRLLRWFRRITNRVFLQDIYDPSDMVAEINAHLASVDDLERMLSGTNDTLKRYLRSEFGCFIISDERHKGFRVIGDDITTPMPIKDIISKVSKARRSHVVIAGALEQGSALQNNMYQHDISVLIKIPVLYSDGKSTEAYVVLGPKKSGSMYTPTDARVLETVASSLVIAMQNAIRFEQIEQFNETLRQRVNDATLQLQRSNRRLQQLDQTKDDFISMASHQLRTPLTSIKGYISMVLEGDAGKINPAQHKMLQQAFISSQRMTYLIADLLNMSRLKTGRFIIEAMPTNLATLVEQEVEQLVETAKSRDLKLTFSPPAQFPDLMLDETKVRQVIMNFVDNAIYYTPAGGKIEIKLEETPKSVELRVVDNGIGVARSEQHHLFTKFYRASNAKRARPDGTGLGLFMAKKVIVAQGGALIFESQEGKGSTFGFSFPKKPAHSVAELAEEKPVHNH